MVSRRQRRARASRRIAGAAVLTLARVASAADCAPESAYSSCFDADARWLAPPNAAFLGVPGAVPLAVGRHHLGAAFGWLERPVVLTLPSPDPNGRELRVVDRVATLTLLASSALGPRATFDATVPLTLAQRGAGMEGVTSLGPAPAPRALRDPRWGVTLGLLHREGRVETALAARYVVVLPLGDERTVGGERGFVGVPSLTGSVRRGRFFAGAEAGARLRAAVQVGDARLGTALVGAAGVGWELLPEERLTLAAEAVATPVLVRRPTLPGADPGARVVPAEWLASVGLRPLGPALPAVMLGLGGGIPLSRAPSGLEATGPSSAVTTPRFRAVITLRQRVGPWPPSRRTSRPSGTAMTTIAAENR